MSVMPSKRIQTIASNTQVVPRTVQQRIAASLNPLNKFLAPPFDSHSGTELVQTIRDETNCEAVSIFMAKQEPTRLDYMAGIGYKHSYADMKYYPKNDPQFLTSHIFNTAVGVNRTHSEVEVELKIPVCERAVFYIETGRAANIIAVPIVPAPGRCYGVVNFENKKTGLTERGRFPDEDFIFASVLANLLGVGFQQRLYGKLTVDPVVPGYDPGRRTLQSQLEVIAVMLKRQVRAECVSIFVRTRQDGGQEVLQYEAGIGYISGYDKKYRLDDKTSFTVHVTDGEDPLLYTAEELVKLKNQNANFAFTGQCVQWIGSGTFRNILGIPIRHEGRTLGVLKLENKLPENEHFNECDAAFCKTFAQGPLLNLLLKSGPLASAKTTTRGYRLLLELGPPANGSRDRPLLQKVRDKQEAAKDEITGSDCAAYLGISRATYYREIRALPKSSKTASKRSISS